MLPLNLVFRTERAETVMVETALHGRVAQLLRVVGLILLVGVVPMACSSNDQVAAIEAEVERVIQRNWEIWVECTTDVDNCEPATALAETENTTSRFYQESVGVVELWRRQGIAYRPVEGRPSDRFVEIRSIEVSPDLTSAEVLLCDRDDRARFERNGAGEYEMVEGTDFVEDLLLRRVVAEDDGEWRIVENELLDRRAVREGTDPLC